MNVLKYLNSKDVRSHLEKLCYKFGPLDAAKIIENCVHIDLNEKHKAFLKLIDETQDEVVVIQGKYILQKKETTLHTLLRNYIDAENEAVRSFHKTDIDSVYIIDDENYITATVCSDYKKELQEFILRGSSERILIKKKNLSTGEETDVCFDKKGHLLWIQDLEKFIIPYTILRFDYSFTELIPTPFEIGDVVIPVGKYKTQPLVITAFDEETVSGYIFSKNHLLETVLHRTTAELEFFPVNEAPELKAVSDFIKGKTELHKFINTYHRIACENYAASCGN